MTDVELLRRFTKSQDEAAFAEVVRRHTDFVYSVAVRVTANGALAQDATQTVFTKLAQQAGRLSRYDTIVGWLHTTARHAAINLVRGEERRRAREQKAFIMQHNSTGPEANWEEIGPLLDEAVGTLTEPDQKAVLLRFFKNQSHQEVGAALGMSEEAARKRVERALEKLRGQFARRGVTASAVALAGAVSGNSVQAAPAGLAEKVMATSLAEAGGAAAGGAMAFSLWAFLMSTKNKIIMAVVVLLLLAGSLAVNWRGAPEAASDRGPSALAPVKAAVPKVMAPAQVAAPVVMPATPVVSTPAQVAATGGAAPAMDPRVEITTAMTDYAHLLEVGDYVSAADNYMQLPPNISGQELIEMMQKNPDFPKTVQMLMEATKAAQTNPPTYNEAGDVVTYELSPPVDGKVRVRWKQIAGRWMVDGYE